jgi:NitT/TauT family transport system ATP-binding protein
MGCRRFVRPEVKSVVESRIEPPDSRSSNVPENPAADPLASGAPVVALRDVGKTFANGIVALERLGLEVRAGELVSLLGPSGCGKSTALRIIAGLSEPTSGAIEWPQAEERSPHGAECGGPPPRIKASRQRRLKRVHARLRRAVASIRATSQRGIGFVFQEPTLMPWATVAANVRLPLKLAGLGPDAQQRVDAALARVGLADFADSYPRELSGGMKMRASIARALVTEPKLLLMDEPFAALDEITRFRLNNDLLALWLALDKTVVFVTHSVFESVYLSQRIVVMTPRPGRVFSELVIDAPYPRDEHFRTSAAYAGYCRRVSEAMAGAMMAGAMEGA